MIWATLASEKRYLTVRYTAYDTNESHRTKNCLCRHASVWVRLRGESLCGATFQLEGKLRVKILLELQRESIKSWIASTIQPLHRVSFWPATNHIDIISLVSFLNPFPTLYPIRSDKIFIYLHTYNRLIFPDSTILGHLEPCQSTMVGFFYRVWSVSGQNYILDMQF